MHHIELFVIAVGLAMDAFAVSICKGLASREVRPLQCLTVGSYFGFFQAAMPLAGYLFGVSFSSLIASVDHWIAFLLLAAIGLKMMMDAREHDAFPDPSLSPRAMLPLAVATSIDALAVGVSFAFLQVRILPAVALIGAVTFCLSALGVRLGGVFGSRFHAPAERTGGGILILMGAKILLEHLCAA